MANRKLIIILGIWVALLPFLGFPQSWDGMLSVMTGAVFVYFGLSMKTQKGSSNQAETSLSESKARRNDVYVENAEIATASKRAVRPRISRPRKSRSIPSPITAEETITQPQDRTYA